MSSPAPWPDPIPGVIGFKSVTVFAGAPGVGKTTMMAEWIQRWRTGRTICGHATNPAAAYYFIAADRSWASHQQWFNAVGYPDIPHYSVVNDPTFNSIDLLKPHEAPAQFARILDRLQPIPGSSVFIDPVAPIYIAGSTNDHRAVARSMVEFHVQTEQRQINLYLTAHFAKQRADPRELYARPQDRVSGTHAWQGFSDTIVYMVDPLPPQQPYTMLGWAPHHARAEDFAFVRDSATGLFIPYDVIREDESSAYILDSFNETGPTDLSLIRDRVLLQHGYSRATVTRALARLLLDGRICKTGRGKYQRVKVH